MVELGDSRERETRIAEAEIGSQVDGPDTVVAGKVGMEALGALQSVGSVEAPSTALQNSAA